MAMATTIKKKHLAAAAVLAALLGGCQTAQGPYGLAADPGLETDGSCVTRKIPVRHPVTGEVFEESQRFCGGKPRLVQ
jgi:hypothetical protein